MRKIGILHAINKWNASRQEKKLSAMKIKDICPECNGIGITPLILNEFIYTPPFDCQGCSGTGLYSAWEELKEQHAE